MAMKTSHYDSQAEGQEHQFLDYRHADVYFVYSFLWDTGKVAWDSLCEEFSTTKGWILPRLHDRAVCHENHALVANYQPSIVSPRRVLERRKEIQRKATLILPLLPNSSVMDSRNRRLEVDLNYTIRMFHNGGMTCTFRACMRKKRSDKKVSAFEDIHAMLHLARNVDYTSPEHQHGTSESEYSHLTDAFLCRNEANPPSNDEDQSLYPEGEEYWTLHDLFRKLINQPPEWATHGTTRLWDNSHVLDTEDTTQDFEAPFVITVAEVERNSFLRFRKHPTLESAREVASIMCKLTLDNRRIRKDYINLSEDYITSVINFNPSRKGLVNYCLDRRLFFSFSKRGAIAITNSADQIPACFVVPSFLNLLEILRARWIMCCVLNMEVDKLIDDLGHGSAGESVHDPKAIDSLSDLRRSYTRFLRDPIPYLFDGGSVTEIAQKAVIELDMDRLSRAIHQKMEIVDAIRQDIEDKERERRREEFDEKWGRVQSLSLEGNND